MGFLISAVLFLAGAVMILDGFMAAGSVSNIMQQDFVQSRLVGGTTILALGSILWVLCSIAETLAKLAKPVQPEVTAKAAPGPVLRPLDQRPAAARSQSPEAAAPSGWTCHECGKVNAPMAPVCPCGNLRA